MGGCFYPQIAQIFADFFGEGKEPRIDADRRGWGERGGENSGIEIRNCRPGLAPLVAAKYLARGAR